MPSALWWIFGFFVVVLVSAFLWGVLQALFTRKTPEEYAGQVLQVWAALGPFESGEESARAMRAAYYAVMGPDTDKSKAPSFDKHIATYEQDPAKWEELQREGAETLDEETRHYAKMAYGIMIKDETD